MTQENREALEYELEQIKNKKAEAYEERNYEKMAEFREQEVLVGIELGIEEYLKKAYIYKPTDE